MTSTRLTLLAILAIVALVYFITRPEPDAEQAATPPLPQPPAEIAAAVKLEVVARGLEKPVFLTTAPGDASGRLFVVEQTGAVRILREGKVLPKPFLDLRRRVSGGVEQGLLGLAFHPGYAANGRLFVNFTDRQGDTQVVEWRVAADDPDRVDPKSERTVLSVDQPFANHNGGCAIFGPDGKLWIGLGDGGAAGDPFGNGQSATALLGKMLLLDVDAPAKGAAPAPKIHQKGLRNPWRYSFDRKTGELYIGDVGQNLYEEVDVVAAKDALAGGQNFGWNTVEGLGHCFKPRRGCDQAGLVQPLVEYGHDAGCSVTGGYVYRGKEIPELDGLYFYADYCTGLLRSFRLHEGKAADPWDWKPVLDPKGKLATLSSFGEDGAGELYLLSLDGNVMRFSRAAAIR